MSKIIPWSFSSLSAYETCPRQFFLTRIARVVKEPPSEQIKWGNTVHKAIELRLKDGTPLPQSMQKWEPIVGPFAKLPELAVENRIALTRNLEPVDWWDKRAWARGIIDVGSTKNSQALLADWKTGKVKSTTDQLALSAAMWMSLKPWVERVRIAFVWLAFGKITRQDLTREELPAIWGDFTARSRRLEDAEEKNRWIPIPSGLCKGWCPVGREHCEYWSPKTVR